MPASRHHRHRSPRHKATQHHSVCARPPEGIRRYNPVIDRMHRQRRLHHKPLHSPRLHAVGCHPAQSEPVDIGRHTERAAPSPVIAQFATQFVDTLHPRRRSHLHCRRTVKHLSALPLQTISGQHRLQLHSPARSLVGKLPVTPQQILAQTVGVGIGQHRRPCGVASRQLPLLCIGAQPHHIGSLKPQRRIRMSPRHSPSPFSLLKPVAVHISHHSPASRAKHHRALHIARHSADVISRILAVKTHKPQTPPILHNAVAASRAVEPRHHRQPTRFRIARRPAGSHKPPPARVTPQIGTLLHTDSGDITLSAHRQTLRTARSDSHHHRSADSPSGQISLISRLLLSRKPVNHNSTIIHKTFISFFQRMFGFKPGLI